MYLKLMIDRIAQALFLNIAVQSPIITTAAILLCFTNVSRYLLNEATVASINGRLYLGK